MANRVLINKQILQDSIDAIRAKKGTTDSIVVADMPTEIASIEGGGSGIADSTKTLVGAISGVTPTDETTLNNAIAKAYADTPSEQKWNGTRATADGGTIKDGVAFVESVKGSTMKYNQLVFDSSFNNPSAWSNAYPNLATMSIAENVCTMTTRTDSAKVFPYLSSKAIFLDSTHYYLLYIDIKASEAITASSGFSYYQNNFGNPTNIAYSTEWKRYTAKRKPNTSHASGKMAYAILSLANGITFSFKNYNCIDLTALGIDNLTTADEVAQYFGYSSIEEMPNMPFSDDVKLLNFTHNTITSKDEDNATLDTLSLNVPSSVFPNGMNGVGTAYDEWKPSEGKAIKRIGKVDLGTLTWSATSVANRYYATLPQSCKRYDAGQSTYICEKYGIKTSGLPTADEDKLINLSNGGYAYVRDTAYSTASAFQSAMSGVYLYCELATESETTTDKAKAFYKVANGGTESVSGGTDSTPIKADIGYRGMSAEELVNAINI